MLRSLILFSTFFVYYVEPSNLLSCYTGSQYERSITPDCTACWSREYITQSIGGPTKQWNYGCTKDGSTCTSSDDLTCCKYNYCNKHHTKNSFDQVSCYDDYKGQNNNVIKYCNICLLKTSLIGKPTIQSCAINCFPESNNVSITTCCSTNYCNLVKLENNLIDCYIGRDNTNYFTKNCSACWSQEYINQNHFHPVKEYNYGCTKADETCTSGGDITCCNYTLCNKQQFKKSLNYVSCYNDRTGKNSNVKKSCNYCQTVITKVVGKLEKQQFCSTDCTSKSDKISNVSCCKTDLCNKVSLNDISFPSSGTK